MENTALNDRIDFINEKRRSAIESANNLYISSFTIPIEHDRICNRINTYYDTQIEASKRMATK